MSFPWKIEDGEQRGQGTRAPDYLFVYSITQYVAEEVEAEEKKYCPNIAKD